MRNDLSTFEFEWLRQLIFGSGTSISPIILKRLRDMGYAERVFSQTRASDLGRARLLVGLNREIRRRGQAWNRP
jgi:hypothetical protein